MIDNIYKGCLKNGLSYYIHKTDLGGNILHIELTIKAGSIADREKKGIAHLLEHCNMSFVKYQFYQDFKYHASAHTDYYNTRYIFTSDKENSKKIFYIIQNLLLGYYLKSEYFAGIKQDILNEYKNKEKNKNYQALKKLFKDTIYAEHMPIGDIKTVNDISFEDVRTFFEDWYVSEISAIIVVGDVCTDEIINEIEKINFFKNNSIKNVEKLNHLLRVNPLPIKDNLIKNNKLYYFYYFLIHEENASNKQYIKDNFAYDFSLDVLEQALKNDSIYSIRKNGCQRSVFSKRYELLYFSFECKKEEMISLEEMRKIIYTNVKRFLEYNFNIIQNEYIYMLNHIEQYLTITNMLKRCMENFAYGINLVNSLEEMETATEFITNLDINRIADCLKNIIMESTVICI